MFLTSSLARVRIQALIQLLNMNVNLVEEENYDGCPNKDRNSSTSTNALSLDNPSDSIEDENWGMLSSITGIRWELFENASEIGEISQKMSQRAVCWMMTVCWSRNLSDQCLWSTLLLFYHLKSQGKVAKEYLQQQLLTCLLVSSKLTCSDALTYKDLLCLSSKKASRESFMELEAEILCNLDFDIFIPHYLIQLHHCSSLSQDHITKISFICELLMVKNHKIFFDKDKIEDLIRIIDGEDWPEYEEIKKQVKEMIKFKDCQIIVKKFQSKLDVESFIQLFL